VARLQQLAMNIGIVLVRAVWGAGAVLAPVGFLAAPDTTYAAGEARQPSLPGGPSLSLPAQRDLNGVWWTASYAPRIAPLGGGAIPFIPAGRQTYDRNVAGLKDHTVVDQARYTCVPDGIPRIWQNPYPFQILQTPGQTSILYERSHVFRIVRMDVKLDEDLITALPWYSGHSVGRWEGDTLIVETAGFKDTTFLDDSGLPQSDQLRVVERIRKLRGGKQLEVEATITDPVNYAAPWTVRYLFVSRPGVRLQTQVCGETHRDLSSVRGATP
jgi:hypothetical protein